MTSPAVRKVPIPIPERSCVVMARSTTLDPWLREMHCGQGRGNLRSTSSPRTDRVTVRATQSLSRMFGMTEVQPECFRRLRRPRYGPGLMTCRARTDVLFTDHRLRLMTLKTGHMSRSPCRDRKPDTAIRRLMTRRTIRLANMSPVIEDGVEASQWREAFYVGRRVTDHADRTRISLREFGGVTRSTRDVSRHFRCRAVAASDMTDETRHSSVLLRVVTKSGKILWRLIRRVVVFRRGRLFFGVREYHHNEK